MVPEEEERSEDIEYPADVRRLVVLGDPHGDVLGLELVLERERRPGVAFVSVGDNVGHADGELSSHFCALLVEHDIPSVFGNHEDWIHDGKLLLVRGGLSRALTTEAHLWCQTLPYRLRLRFAAAPGLAVHVVHSFRGWSYVDAGSAPRLLAREEEADVVFCGHTHRPALYAEEPLGAEADAQRFDPRRKRPLLVERDPRRRYVVDAGSLAFPERVRGGPCPDRATYAALDLERGRIELHAVDKGPRLRALFAASADEGPR